MSETKTENSRQEYLRMLLWLGGMFGAVYAGALTFVYIEGDDAASVAFHAMGRNGDLQPPYNSHHGMMDVFLGLLPANEIVVRHVAMALSAVAAMSMTVLVVMLIGQWLGKDIFKRPWLIAMALVLCSPEIFYLGLVYTPSLIAMNLVLCAHLMVRNTITRTPTEVPRIGEFGTRLILSSVIFGIGVACRWDIGAYLGLIVADILLTEPSGTSLCRRSAVLGVWCLLAIAFSVAMVGVSGYGFDEFVGTLNLAREEVSKTVSWIALIGAHQTLFTPASLVFMIVGLGYTCVRRPRLAILALIGTLMVFHFLISREPKMLLPALPVFWLLAAQGISCTFERSVDGALGHAIRVMLIGLMIAPWLIGLKVETPDTAWGPGFQIKVPLGKSRIDEQFELVTGAIDDRKVGIGRFNLDLAGGFAVPTLEGPRPVGGHGFVLFFGEWRSLARYRDDERRRAIEMASLNDLTIIQDDGNSYIETKLLELGFSTDQPKSYETSKGYVDRTFFHADGRTVKTQVLKVRTSLLTLAAQINELLEADRDGKVVLYSGYTSTIRRLAETAPEAITSLGPFSAVVDLRVLADRLSAANRI